MTIEAILERLASAAERQATAMDKMVTIQLKGTPSEPAALTKETQKAEDSAPSYAEQRKAEVKAEIKAEAVAAKRSPGRPRKEEVKPEPVKEPEVEDTDPFGEPEVEAAPVKEITTADIREVMVKLREKVGKEKAYSLLREAGNGATYLPGSTAAATSGGTTELKPEYFRAVVEAANKLIG